MIKNPHPTHYPAQPPAHHARPRAVARLVFGRCNHARFWLNSLLPLIILLSYNRAGDSSRDALVTQPLSPGVSIPSRTFFVIRSVIGSSRLACSPTHHSVLPAWTTCSTYESLYVSYLQLLFTGHDPRRITYSHELQNNDAHPTAVVAHQPLNHHSVAHSGAIDRRLHLITIAAHCYQPLVAQHTGVAGKSNCKNLQRAIR